MLPKLLTQIFGSRNERLLKGYRRIVQQINALGAAVRSSLDDAALQAKTEEFKQRDRWRASRLTRSCLKHLLSAAKAASVS